MSISSRTPEGQPLKCPLCGKQAAMEVSPVTGDVTCPTCGQLLWEHRDLVIGWRAFVAKQLGIDPNEVTLDASLLAGLSGDSLEVVEIVMELEEEFDLDIPFEEAQKMRTFGDLLRWLAKRRREES